MLDIVLGAIAELILISSSAFCLYNHFRKLNFLVISATHKRRFKL